MNNFTLKDLKNISKKINNNIDLNQSKINLYNDIIETLKVCNNKPLIDPIKELDSNNLFYIAKNFENKSFKLFGVYDSKSIKNINIPNKFNKGAIILKIDNHWVMIYINLKKKYIYYYDSFGKNPPKIIKDFILYISKLLDINTIEINKNIDQNSNTKLCGYYVLNELKNKINNSNKSLNIFDFIC